ncbi:MAG: PhzF family phenazine biosynthesis protein [Pseudomonadota bacterium]
MGLKDEEADMYDFMWIDAFTESRFGGNPCAVVFGADDISVEDRIAFTRETGLVECAFIVASDAADFGARYYMPTGEILMAGHPTVATVSAMIEAGMVDLTGGAASFTLEVGAGVIGIEAAAQEARPPLVTMTQLRPEFLRQYPAREIAALYGLTADDVIGEPQTVSTGTPFCITRISSIDAIRRAKLDVDALAKYRERVDADFMEPYLCVTEGAEAGDTFGRLLLPPPFPPEDPFTGSATGCMASYLYRNGWIGQRFVHEQGHDLGRPGRADVELLGPPDDISGVKVAGSGVLIMRGTVDI